MYLEGLSVGVTMEVIIVALCGNKYQNKGTGSVWNEYPSYIAETYPYDDGANQWFVSSNIITDKYSPGFTQILILKESGLLS